jgi:hypothetical protein
MPSDVLVNNLGLTYKSTIGMSMATLPDVCKTPSPAGPVPIPYPNAADQSTLKNGTTTVMVHGQMAAIKGSEYSVSTGDEPGTVGGVTSNTFKKETEWITYSFDVKLDGANACRHTDKKFHNHKNTVDMAGNMDPVAAGAKALQDIVCKCDELKPKKRETCRQLGERKHSCCNDAIADHNAKDKTPTLQGERGYIEKTGKYDPTATRVWPPGASPKQYFKSIAGKIFPDAAILDTDGNVAAFCEFKFQCPEGVRTRKGAKKSKGTAKQGWTPATDTKEDQFTRTLALGDKQAIPPTSDPQLITNEKC